MYKTEYDFELAPHLIKLLVDESNWTLKNMPEVCGPRDAVCSFSLGRQKGHSTAILDFIGQDETCDMIYVILPNENLVRTYQKEHSHYRAKYASVRSVPLIDMMSGVPYKNIGIFFDSCTRKQVNDVCVNVTPIIDKIEFIVSVGEI